MVFRPGLLATEKSESIFGKARSFPSRSSLSPRPAKDPERVEICRLSRLSKGEIGFLEQPPSESESADRYLPC
jgi:hypothetical protein